MSIKNSLTNEKLNQRFENPFALVNYAIQIARMRVQRGEGTDANPVNEVLEYIVEGRDIYESLDDEEENEEENS